MFVEDVIDWRINGVGDIKINYGVFYLFYFNFIIYICLKKVFKEDVYNFVLFLLNKWFVMFCNYVFEKVVRDEY